LPLLKFQHSYKISALPVLKLRTLAPRVHYVHTEIICSDEKQHVHDKQPNI